MPGRYRVLCSAAMAAGLLAAAVEPASASTDGQIAADQVSLASYTDFLDNWLFTHAGDSRGRFSPQLLQARDNIAAFMTSYGLTVTLEPFTFGGTTYHNVVGTQVGTLLPDQEYVVGAHYDSVGNPGADDNASGTALVLEAARVLSQYESAYTIRFVAFSMEEVGLVGSHAYVDAHQGDDIRGMISTDMVAFDTGNDEAAVWGNSNADPLEAALGNAINTYGDGLTYVNRGNSGGSDHVPFATAGYQAALLIENDFSNNIYYHTQNDNFDNPDNLNLPFAVKMVRSVVGFLADQAGVETRTDRLDFVFPDSLTDKIDPAGGTVMRVEVFGVGNTVPQPGTAVLHFNDGTGWQALPMNVIADNVYDAVFPAVDCNADISYYVSAEATDAEQFPYPRNAPQTNWSAVASFGQMVAVAYNLDTDPMWTTEGDWAYGQPTGGGGANGSPDPTSGHTGNNVYGYNLDGDYPNDLPEMWLTSEPIDCTGLIDVHLHFWRWLGVDLGLFDHSQVRVSNNGIDWTTVWSGGRVVDTEWVEVDLNISDLADDQPTVYLRWTMGTTNSTQTYCGWNIDDVQIWAVDCDPAEAFITGARSCLNHGPAGDLCLNLATSNVEPRQDGVQTLEFDVSEPVSNVSASVSCVNNPYQGAATAVPNGTMVTVSLVPAPDDQDCCTVTLTGDVDDSFAVRTLAGDIDRDGTVATTDASIIKPYFGATPDAVSAGHDFDASGLIATTDFSLIKPLFGHTAPTCP